MTETVSKNPLWIFPLQHLYAMIAVVFLLSKVVDGASRWLLGQFGLAPLVYIPIAASLAVIMGHSIVVLGRLRGPKASFAFMLLLIISALIGFVQIGVPKQVAFGIYVFTPVIFGMIAYKGLYEDHLPWLPTLALWIFILSAIGAMLDVALTLPWSGYSFEVAGQEVSASRAWTTHGFERIAGFSRASYSLAKQALISALLYICFGRSEPAKWMMWLGAAVIIILTTTKGVLIAWLCISLYFVFRKLTPGFIIRSLPALTVIVGILLPTLAYFMDFSQLFEDNFLLKLTLASFKTRLTQVWPMTIQMIHDHGSWIIGRGLGGIGTAQVGRDTFYSPGDNMFVYFFGVLGMLSVFLYIPWIYKLAQLKIKESKSDHFIFLFTLFIFIYGMTTGIVEDPFIGFLLGISIAHLFIKKDFLNEQSR